MAAVVNAGNSAAILTAIEAADFKNSEPAESKTHVAATQIFQCNDGMRDDIFNMICGRNFDIGMEAHGDALADGFDVRHIAEASALLYRRLMRHYGRAGAQRILSRVPMRIYQNGIHSSSAKTTQLCAYDQATFGNAATIAGRLVATGEQKAEADSFAGRMIDYIPYEAFTRVVNKMGGRLSKRMLIRIVVLKLKALHDGNAAGGVKNSFTHSLGKYGIVVDPIDLFPEWRFFGADFHPSFPTAQLQAYTDVRSAIFIKAQAAQGAPSPFRAL